MLEHTESEEKPERHPASEMTMKTIAPQRRSEPREGTEKKPPDPKGTRADGRR